MNPYLQEYITRTREYHAKDGNPSSVAALYDLADELTKTFLASKSSDLANSSAKS